MADTKATATGTVHHVGEIQTFGANGTTKRTLVIKTGEYQGRDKLLAVELYKDLAHGLDTKPGDDVTVDYWPPESREHNGKYYTNVRAANVMVRPAPGANQAEQFAGNDQDIPF